jgi:hypothetical protein
VPADPRKLSILVDDLGSALDSGASGLRHVPVFLVRVIEEEAWRDRVHHKTRERFTFGSFREFVETDPLAGLGGDVETLERICKGSLAEVPLREALKAKPVKGAPIHRNNVTTGNSSAYARSRLEREHPDLAELVNQGELTPNAAAIRAGFRKPTATVPVDTAESAVRALARRFPLADLRDAFDSLRESGETAA